MDSTPGTYVPKSKTAKRHRRLYLLPLYGFAGALLIVIGVGWFFLSSPFFAVRKINVTGNVTVSGADILTAVKSGMLRHGFWNSVLGFDNMLAWPSSIVSSTLRLLPSVKNIDIVKSYGTKSVDVVTHERSAVGVWCVGAGVSTPVMLGDAKAVATSTLESDAPTNASDDACWWFDDQGIIFRKAIPSEGGLIATMWDDSHRTLGLNLTILPDEFITNALSIFTVLGKSPVHVKKVALHDLTLREIEVETYDGPKLYFSIAFPADDSIAQVIADFYTKPTLKNMAYLDFRVQGKLFYK